MIGLALKWLAIALFALAVFSALTAIYMYYVLNFGACSANGPDGADLDCSTRHATLYASGIGIVGFSVSAYAAHVIGKGFRQNGD